MIGPAPDITSARVLRHGVLRITFADGFTGEVESGCRLKGGADNCSSSRAKARGV
jgi:hypothetical protein